MCRKPVVAVIGGKKLSLRRGNMKRWIVEALAFALAFALALALVFVAVDDYVHRIQAGWIIEKTYSPAHTVRYITYMPVNKVMIPIWHTDYYKDKWAFTIENSDERASWDVQKSVYDSYSVGDWFELKDAE